MNKNINTVLLILILAVCSVLLLKNYQNSPKSEMKKELEESTNTTPNSLSDEPTMDTQTDQELIAQALVKKDKINLELVDVIVRVNTGKYASGSVSPKELGIGGGGYFFAAKVPSGWVIVAAGNGIISCTDVAPYPDLPTSMIPECVDLTTGTLVKR